MSSERESRQRAAARARLEREMAARQDKARRRRVLQAQIGAGAALAVVLGAVIWIVVAVSGDDSQPASTTTTAKCVWNNDFAAATDPTATPTPTATPALPEGIKDVGVPPTDPPRSGFQVITFETNLGKIAVEMDLSKTPCTAASLSHLVKQAFYDGSTCHRLVAGIFALQCGDPSGTGRGGPTYRFDNENLPTGKKPAYHAGDVAMANTGQPSSNGSQFFFIWDNSPLPADYTLWGRVIEGMDIVAAVGAAGDDGAYEAEAGGGHPKKKITLEKVTVSEVSPTSAAVPATTPPATTAPAATEPTPSATP